MQPKSSHEAILTNDNVYTAFIHNGIQVRFMTSPRLERYTQVKTWDPHTGYLEVMAKYRHRAQPVEEYIDLMPILENLIIRPQDFLAQVKTVRIAYE